MVTRRLKLPKVLNKKEGVILWRSHLKTALCNAYLIEVESTNIMAFTFIKEVIYNVVYKCDIPSIFQKEDTIVIASFF